MAAEGSTGGWIVGSLFIKKAGIAHASGSGAPVTNGTSGTLAGKAAIGCTYFDTVTGNNWTNVGTKASPVWSPEGAVIFDVTSANILAMNGAPVVVVAAPPAGFSVILNNLLVQMTRTATAYASGGVVNLVYHGGAVVPHSGSMPASVVTGGAGVVLNQMGPVSAANGIVVPTATGLDITNGTGAFTTGTGTMRLYIAYSVVKQ